MNETFQRTTVLPFPAEEVFNWHARPGALARLNLPWNPARVIADSGGIADGSRAEFSLRVGPFRRRWVAEHRNVVDGRQFQDVQVTGPFAAWEHTHTITPVGDAECELRDEIHYRFPAGLLGRWAGGSITRRALERAFRYRHRLTLGDLRTHSRYSKARPMKILVSGSSGLVGSKLRPFLTTGGHEVVPLVRPETKGADSAITWDIGQGTIDREKLNGFDAVVHLAGENIGEKRWSEKQKQRIRDSRVNGTRLLSETLAGLENPPKILVCASAIGYYGDRGDDVLDESSPPGEGFLPDVCREWEAAADAARDKGIRVVHTRFGMILSPEGGALKKMLLPFKLCAGGVVGGGKQYWSWVGIDDVIAAILHAVSTDGVQGPINAVSPNPVTNREFTKVLGRVLGRPTIFPMPGFLARLALGEMADSLLLPSAYVLPKRLQETGFEFRNPDLEDCLRHLLGTG